jgi:hypothetical protein
MEKIRTHKDLKAYQLSFECGMAIFHRFGPMKYNLINYISWLWGSSLLKTVFIDMGNIS